MDVNRFRKTENMLDLSSQEIAVFPTISTLQRLQIQPHLLTHLNLSGNRMKFIPDDVIGYFTNLITLDLSSNELGYLPCGLCKLTKLKTLLVKNNVLCELPKCKSSSQSLEILNVSGNKLELFPAQVLQLLQLKQLHLGGNRIHTIPKEIMQLTRYNS